MNEEKSPINKTFITDDEKTWGMIVHLAALVAFIASPIGAVLGPLVVWLIKKEQMPFVKDQGKEAMNFNISILLYGLASGVLIFIGIGLLLLMLLGIFWIMFVIIGGIKAQKGEYFRYPLTIRFIK